jgi:hypothetical protein
VFGQRNGLKICHLRGSVGHPTPGRFGRGSVSVRIFRPSKDKFLEFFKLQNQKAPGYTAS